MRRFQNIAQLRRMALRQFAPQKILPWMRRASFTRARVCPPRWDNSDAPGLCPSIRFRASTFRFQGVCVRDRSGWIVSVPARRRRIRQDNL